MKLEIMETATKHGKPIWDSIVVAAGSVGVFLQSVISIETLTWAQIFAALGVGTFAFTRAYFWLRNKGYENGKAEN